MMPRGPWIVAAAALLLCPALGFADPINVGFLSFDTLIPGDGTPGVNVVNVLNLTGDPALGGFALPLDFPVLDFVTILNASLTLIGSGPPVTITLGDLGPGGLSSTAGLEFADTTLFSSAVFTGTLSQSSFALADGSIFTSGSSLITATLLPLSGSFLAPGDFALITLSSAPAPIPEPGTWVLLATGIVLVIGTKYRIRNRRG